MLAAVFRIMWLRLWRDKGALILAFILPGFIFAIFAAIFSNASGGQLDIRAAMAVTSKVEATQSFAVTISDNATFSLSTDENWTESEVKERVRLGQEDVGFILFGDITDPSTPSIQIIKDPSRDIAATILMGQLRQELSKLSNQQSARIFSETSALKLENDTAQTDQSVTYYIGATAILFLLFSAMQGASISLEERKSGISDRMLTGPMGAASMTFGKFLFLTLVGTLQAVIIVSVAGLFFHVSVLSMALPLLLASICAAALAASIALLTVSLCDSLSQMNTVSTFLVLLFSAVGGSMVPRFMMPDWLQNIGIFTPNHWVIESYYGILARGQSVSDLIVVWGVIFSAMSVCLFLAVLISHKMMRV